jgi:hypothetical protein
MELRYGNGEHIITKGGKLIAASHFIDHSSMF